MKSFLNIDRRWSLVIYWLERKSTRDRRLTLFDWLICHEEIFLEVRRTTKFFFSTRLDAFHLFPSTEKNSVEFGEAEPRSQRTRRTNKLCQSAERNIVFLRRYEYLSKETVRNIPRRCRDEGKRRIVGCTCIVDQHFYGNLMRRIRRQRSFIKITRRSESNKASLSFLFLLLVSPCRDQLKTVKTYLTFEIEIKADLFVEFSFDR